jgi:hypothetical protein
MYIRPIVLAVAVGCSSAFAPTPRGALATTLAMASDFSTEDRRSFVTKVSKFSGEKLAEIFL